MTELDLRRATRYQLVAVVDFWWLNLNGSVQGSHGITHDISSNGVLIEANECPPIGVHIQMTILIPRMSDSGSSLELHGEGTVVRIERCAKLQLAQKSSAFAASVQFHSESPSESEMHNREQSVPF
jgi:PilZ domain